MFAVTAADALGALWAVVAFTIVLLLPGYAVGRCLLPLAYRSAWHERLCWAVVLSFCVAPICLVLLAKTILLPAACGVALASGCAGACFVLWDLFREGRRWPKGATIIVLGVCLWTAFAVAELVDLGVGHNLYMSVTVYDQALRTAFVDAVMRTGVPPANPLFCADASGPGHCAPMHYYYFWYVLCAVVARIARVTARQSMIASCVWGGLGLGALLRLYWQHFQVGVRRWTILLALLAVTGLDIIPVTVNFLTGGPTDPDMEWWGVDQVSSWLDSLLWVPHHVAALVCCLTAFLLVWAQPPANLGDRLKMIALAAAAFASAFGLSVYVALGFALTVALWSIWVFFFEPARRIRVHVLASAAALAAVFSLPFLRELYASGAGAGAAGVPLALGIRQIINPSSLVDAGWLHRLAMSSPQAATDVAAALLLIPGYLAELGFFAVALVWAMSTVLRRRRGEEFRSCVVLSFAALLVVSVVRSTAIQTNDFGIRASLMVQFFLLLLGAAWWEATQAQSGWRKTSARLLATFGIVASAYQAIELRTFLLVEDRRGVSGFAGLAEQHAALRRALDAAGGRRDRTSVLQYNGVEPSEWFRFAQILGAGAQIAKASPGCDAEFGGARKFCGPMEAAQSRLFQSDLPMSADEAREQCRRLGATALQATRWDRVWAERDRWVWTLPVLSATDDVRTVGCSPLGDAFSNE